MTSDPLGALARTAWIELHDCACQLGVEATVLFRLPYTIALPAARPSIRISQAVCFGLLKRLLLDQDTLALVPLPRAAEADDDRRQVTRFSRTPGQRRVPGRQVDEVIQVSTLEA